MKFSIGLNVLKNSIIVQKLLNLNKKYHQIIMCLITLIKLIDLNKFVDFFHMLLQLPY